MNLTLKSILIWLFAILFTVALAMYQRMTGPTYPVRGTTEIGQQTIKYKLIRSYDKQDDAPIRIVAADTSIKGELKLRRFKSYDTWHIQPMQRHGDTLVGYLPHQEPAGKVMYQVTLVKDNQRILLNDHPAVLRYTGFVSWIVLLPHILFVFCGMLFSTLTGMMVIFRMKNTYIYAWITVITTGIGVLILGPIMQKLAFDAFWTGWPFGHDLTDNKSLVAFIFWVIALVVMKKNRENRLWPILASIVLLAIFLIPHSVLGSETDFTKEKQIETTK
jgi:hypothetical protein